ncbi:MAG: TIGR01212 family radical SAM protein, partial [Muribaculaceae bacterium]|nr:TIGR01212 family radical SAM protein [Muribaculaceae bacterium]
MANPWYKDYSEYLAERWPGVKVQKLSVDAGFSCPNRDGTIGRGGCIYCDNRTITTGYSDARRSVA